MAALAAVARCQHRISVLAPGADHALDGLRSEIGPVGQDDDRRLGVRSQRLEAAAERGAGAALPLGTADDARIGVDVVRAEHDDDVVHGAPTHPLEHVGEEKPLLGGTEARRRPGGEDDRPDQRQPRRARHVAVTFAT